jgi:hypothetical protein
MLYNLRKRHVSMTYWCCMCKNSGEYTDHLLLHYVVPRDLRASIFSLFGSCTNG